MIVSRANQRVMLTPHIQGYLRLHYISISHDLVLEYLGWPPRLMYQVFLKSGTTEVIRGQLRITIYDESLVPSLSNKNIVVMFPKG